MPLSVNIDGAYKNMSTCKVNIGGSWKQAESVHTNIGGVWKLAWQNVTLQTVVFNSSTSWTVPAGVTKVDVFIVGGGGGGGGSTGSISGGGGGGGGYTKTYLNVPVTAGSSIPIVIGAGGYARGGTNGNDGNLSEFMDSNYRASGGKAGYKFTDDYSAWGTDGRGGDGGSGGGSAGTARDSTGGNGGSNGGNGGQASKPISGTTVGVGQGTTTREFGETTGTLYAGGGGAAAGIQYNYRSSGGSGGGGGGSYSGDSYGVAGTANTGGGGGGNSMSSGVYVQGSGGSGKVIVRYYA